MRTKTKKTKQITQIVVSMLLVLTMVFMPMKMILAADAQSSSTPTQFVLVLDCSGSMEESDVNGLSPKAAKMFVDMMPVENAQIAVVALVRTGEKILMFIRVIPQATLIQRLSLV